MPLDTVPQVRPDQAHPFGHSVDSISDPCRILFFLDVARIGETVFAHEVVHVWVELVEGTEDYRVLRDQSEPTRYSQVQQLQSFVLDFRVNAFLRSRGFDLAEIEEDRRMSLVQFAASVVAGYRPPTPWESVFVATFLAESMVEPAATLARADDVLARMREDLPLEWGLAEALTNALEKHPPTAAETVAQCIDQVLTMCFAHAGEHLDLDADLVHMPPEVHWYDKWPEWLPGLTPMQKCEVGRAMARADVGSPTTVEMRSSEEMTQARFWEEGKDWTEWLPLPFHIPRTRPEISGIERIVAINERNRRNAMERLNSPTHGRRTYSPGMARWLSQVRMQEYLEGEHPYAYANNNPVKYVDPSGFKASADLSRFGLVQEKPLCETLKLTPTNDPSGCRCCIAKATIPKDAPCSIQRGGPDFSCVWKQCGRPYADLTYAPVFGKCRVFGRSVEYYIGVYPDPVRDNPTAGLPVIRGGIITRF